MAVSAKTAQINGQSVGYLEDGAGNGRTLLLLHGGIGDAALHWESVMPLLADEFHLIAPDLPGFGRSAPLPTLRTEALLGWLKALLAELGIEQAVVVGSSLGALVARLFAAASPQIVPAVVLVGGGGVPDLPGSLRLLNRLPLVSGLLFGHFGRIGTAPDTLKRIIYAEDVVTDDFMTRARRAASGYTTLMRMLVAAPLPAEQTPLVPTLILWGANDGLAPVSSAQAIKESIPGAVLTEIADCGHLPQLETPDVFTWQVSAFLKKLSRPQRPDLPGAGFLPDIPTG
jgi:pimeloyl-ACP methyl ester carboxylesterase